MKNHKTRGATKVPNVKLRPAQASSSRSGKRQSSLPRVGLYEDAGQDEVDISTGNRPFQGIVLCATGDLNKRTLFAHAQELGATRANDFTDLVTHLVADAPGSAKYRCALERNLPILKESWVEEAYQTWLNGDVVDLEQTVKDHRLPVFSGVRLCITGLDDVDLRGKIHKLLVKQDGVYLKSLDKTATHLLTCTPGESPKIKWANDHNKSRKGTDKIHIIWEEWFWDSLEFGGRWREREYEVTNLRPTRKSPSQIPQSVGVNLSHSLLPTASLSQRTPLPQSLPNSSLLGDDPPEYGKMNKVADAGLRLFESIVQKRGYAVGSDGVLQRTRDADAKSKPFTPSTPIAQRQDAARPKLKPKAVTADADDDADSVLTRLANHRATSFAYASSSQAQPRQPFRRIASTASSEPAVTSQASFLGGGSKATTESHFFEGYTFRAFGEAKGPVLRGALEACGGRWLTEDDEDEDADFLIVRLVSGSMFWRDEGDEGERAKYRTECWVERCLFEERICAPQEHVVFTPLKIDAPVAGSEKLHISLSGLDSAEMCWVKRLVRALGGDICSTFSRRATHLLCPSGRGAKYEKAKEWGVSVVGMRWLLDIATTGQVPKASQFAVTPKPEESIAMEVDEDTGTKADLKGKWKAAAEHEEEFIVDITNGLSQESQSSKRHGPSSSSKELNMGKKSLAVDNSQSTPLKTRPGRANTEPAPSENHFRSEFTFGQPNELLLGPASALPSPKQEMGAKPSPLSAAVRLATPKSTHTGRRFSASEIEEDKRTTTIPSSHSPSPLKIPSKPVPACSPPISETRGLRTAITALLGKRGTEARDELDGPLSKPQGRTSKRPRLPSRAKSDLQGGGGPSPALSFISGSPAPSRMSSHEDVDAIPEEEQADLRVVYEDPDQREEKRRLIALFEGAGTAPDGSNPGTKDGSVAARGKYHARTDANAGTASKRKLVRRSTRTSGV